MPTPISVIFGFLTTYLTVSRLQHCVTGAPVLNLSGFTYSSTYTSLQGRCRIRQGELVWSEHGR